MSASGVCAFAAPAKKKNITEKNRIYCPHDDKNWETSKNIGIRPCRLREARAAVAGGAPPVMGDARPSHAARADRFYIHRGCLHVEQPRPAVAVACKRRAGRAVV